MRRARLRQPTPTASLFPFLAVLICTMGALVVLLVILVQQARTEAHGISDQTEMLRAEAEAQRQLEREDFEWRLEVLQNARLQKQKELERERLRLSGLEDHVRRVQEELGKLRRAAEAMQQPLNSKFAEQEDRRRQLEELQRTIAQRRQELEKAEQQLHDRPRSFSIVAYQGPQGTLRRPVFIECLPDRVILQPEAIVLTEKDFQSPLGPGNPLAAALRATREYLAEHGHLKGVGEPYPLLVVRPHSSQAYTAARRAMKSWDAEFGYELIDNEMQLKYPPADPELAERLKRTVQEARRRRVYLARAAPSRYRRSGGSGVGSELVASQHGGFVRRDGGSSSVVDNGWGEQGNGDVQDSSEEDGQGSQSHQAVGHDVSEVGGQNSLQASSQGADSGVSAQQAPAGVTVDRQKNSLSVRSLAQSRGSNWGLPNSSPRAIAFARPIRISCYLDRLVLHPEKGDPAPPRITKFRDSARASVDQFVSHVWSHMDRWGIAGAGSYWKPVLMVEVADDADQRFLKLQSLLDSSGIEVRRNTR